MKIMNDFEAAFLLILGTSNNSAYKNNKNGNVLTNPAKTTGSLPGM